MGKASIKKIQDIDYKLNCLYRKLGMYKDYNKNQRIQFEIEELKRLKFKEKIRSMIWRIRLFIYI